MFHVMYPDTAKIDTLSAYFETHSAGISRALEKTAKKATFSKAFRSS